MVAAAYSDTLGEPGHGPFHRVLRATGVPLITHDYFNEDHFPYERVEVVPMRAGLFDALATGVRRLKTRHGYRLPMSMELRLMDRMLEHGATTIHAYGGAAAARIAPVARRLDCRLLVTFLGPDARLVDDRYRAAMRALFRESSRVLAPLASVRDHLRELGCPDDKLELLTHGIALRPMRPRRATNRDGVRAISVARLRPINGMAELVEAVALARRMGAPLTLDVVGDGADLEKVRATIERSRLQAHVRLHGDLVPDAMHKLLDRSDLFVLNRRASEEEELPGAVLEAMASGLCVVSTRAGSIPEAVRHEVTGLLLDSPGTSELARALVTTANDAALRVAQGAAGRARVERDFDLARSVERLRELYL